MPSNAPVTIVPEPMEGVVKYEGTPELDEESLKKRIDQRMASCKKFYDELWTVSENTRKYWQGQQINETDIYEGESRVIINRIFLSMETIVPIVLARDPEPRVEIFPRGTKVNQLKDKLTRHLDDLWNIEWEMPVRLANIVRQLMTDRFAAVKYYWDPESKLMKVCLLPRGTLMFPEKVKSVDDSPFIIEKVTERLGDILQKFPDKEEELFNELGANPDMSDDSMVTYIEYWEDDMVVWKYKKCLLGVAKNPNYNYDKPEANVFFKPKKPYEFLTYLNFGDSIVDPVSLVEQAISLQDNINKRKRTIELNASLGNGKLVASGDFMDKESFDKITNDPQEKVFMEKGDPSKGLFFFTGRAFDPGIFNDMQDSINQIDNIMGTHATTRGERSSNETLGGRMLLKDSDTGRLDLLTRNVAAFKQRLMNDAIQMIYVYYTEPQPILTLPHEENIYDLTEKDLENTLASEDLIGKKIRVVIDPNSSTPESRIALKAQALQLFQLGALSIKDLHEALDNPHPEQLARNAVMEKADPTFVYPLAKDGESFDLDAITHMKMLFDEGIDISQEMYISTDQDPEKLSRHIRTHTDYLRGIEVDEDLALVDDIGSQTLEILRLHIDRENKLLKIMAINLMNSQQSPLQQGASGMPPQMPQNQTQMPPEQTQPPMPM